MVTIHGRDVPIQDLLGMDQAALDEFESALDFEEDESSAEEEEEPHPAPTSIPTPTVGAEFRAEPTRTRAPKKSEPRTVFQPTSQPSGIDWRGIPLRMYMGSIRPYYKRLDRKTQQLLRTEIEGEMRQITSLYADLKFPDYPPDTDMDIIHHDYQTKHDIARARNAAATWRQTILGVSAAIEGVLLLMGIEQARDFTNTQMKTLPIYDTMVLEMSMKHKGGAYSILPPEMKIGIMICVNIMIYVGAQWWLGGNKNAEVYEKVVGVIHNLYTKLSNAGAGTPAAAPTPVPGAAPGTAPVGDSPIPRAPAAPSAADPQQIMASLATSAAPFMTALRGMFSGASPAPTPEPTPSSAPRPRGRTARR